MPSEISDRPRIMWMWAPLCAESTHSRLGSIAASGTPNARTNPSIGRTSRASAPAMVHPAESPRDPPTTTRPEPSTSTPTWALVSSAGRAIDRLQAFAVAVRALASDAKARLDALPDENDDGRPETVKARVPPRPRARRPRATSRHPRRAQALAARVDAALVAHHRRRQGDDQPPAKPQKTSPAPPPSSPQSSRRRRRTDSSPPFRNSPKVTSAGSARGGDGDGDGDGNRDGDERRRRVPTPSRVYRTGMRLAPQNPALEISDRARAGARRRSPRRDSALRAEERDVDARARLAAEIHSLGVSANGVDSSSTAANDVRSSSAPAYTEKISRTGARPSGVGSG